jgi:DNA-binding XRE family transcriptional regulator
MRKQRTTKKTVPEFADGFDGNWPGVISGLQGYGMTQVEIAAHVGCGQTHISEIKCGRIVSPSWKIGAKLLSLLRARKDAAIAAKALFERE